MKNNDDVATLIIPISVCYYLELCNAITSRKLCEINRSRFPIVVLLTILICSR